MEFDNDNKCRYINCVKKEKLCIIICTYTHTHEASKYAKAIDVGTQRTYSLVGTERWITIVSTLISFQATQ